MLLEEFDESREAIVEPTSLIDKISNIPSVAIACFSGRFFYGMIQSLKVEPFTDADGKSIAGKLYIADYKNEKILIFRAPMGASVCVTALEELYAMGVEKVVMFGSCGVLQNDIPEYSVIIPTYALRDEGTSYHYAPPSNEIAVNPLYTTEFEELLNDMKIQYAKGKVWTTDAFFRETYKKLKLRKEQGCICVDMECSAAAAVTAFRGKELFHFFYAADALSDEGWDTRNLNGAGNTEIQTKISKLALNLALCMKKGKL